MGSRLSQTGDSRSTLSFPLSFSLWVDMVWLFTLRNMPCVVLIVFITTHSYAMWKLHSGDCEDETRSPLLYCYFNFGVTPVYAIRSTSHKTHRSCKSRQGLGLSLSCIILKGLADGMALSKGHYPTINK